MDKKENKTLKILANIFLIFFLYLLVYFTYRGIITRPAEGDSLAYHIPIANEILNGNFFHPEITNVLHFYPSSIEVLLSILIFLNIPLNLFNVFGVIALSFSLNFLAKSFGLNKFLSMIFSIVICTLHLTLRWIDTQVVDIWLLVFFSLSLGLLQKPKITFTYFLKLGLCIGMLVGAKFTGIFLAIILIVFYLKKLSTFLNIKRILLFLFPILLLGLFWYIRNFVIIGNPFYPQTFLFFKGAQNINMLKWNVGTIFLNHPLQVLNAFFGEYQIWSFSLLFPLVFLFLRKKIVSFDVAKKLIPLMLIGVLNFIFFIFLPSSNNAGSMISSFRYSYPAFVPLILSIFIVAKEFNKEEILTYLAFISMLILPTINYYPKLLFIVSGLFFLLDWKLKLKKP